MADRFEPDVRFLLANERTLLAWVRTSIALQAGGIILANIGTNTTKAQSMFGVIIVAVGAITAIVGLQRFRATDKAIRSAKLPTMGLMPVLEAVSLVLIAFALILFILLGMR